MVIVILGSNSNDGNNVGDNYNKECGDKNDDNNNNNNNNNNDNGNHYSDDSE